MLYDLTSDIQRSAFLARIDLLLDKGSVVDLTEKTFRSRSQNSYLHLLIGVVAMETGNTLEDTKRWYFKETCNKDIFLAQHRDKMGHIINHLRSTADLSKEEMSIAIDRFIRWGNENGIYMPHPGDEQLLRDIEIQMSRQRAFLY